MSAQPSYRLTPGGGLTAKGVIARGLAAVVGVATLTAALDFDETGHLQKPAGGVSSIVHG